MTEGLRSRWKSPIRSLAKFAGSLGALLVLALPHAAGAAPLRPGEIVVADPVARSVFLVDPGTGAVTTLASGAPFILPTSVAIDGRGKILVADEQADPAGLGGSPGAIFRFAPGNSPSVLAASTMFKDPSGVASDAQGRILVADEAADPAGLGGDTGAILRFTPGGVPTVLATSALFVNPIGVALDKRGDVLVADPRADPFGVGGSPGAIFRFAPGSAPAPLATSPMFVDPSSVALDAGGNILVADRTADPNGIGGSPGAIFRFAPGSAPAPLATSLLFEDPFGVALDARGNVLVADRDADPAGIGGSPGAIFRFSPGGLPAPLAVSALFNNPRGIAIVPPKCFGSFATIVGDSGPNRLRGTSGRDVISGGGGRDRLTGGKGGDLLCGGRGKDMLRGGAGNDKLQGEAGPDTLIGGKGRDQLTGGKGRDNVRQ